MPQVSGGGGGGGGGDGGGGDGDEPRFLGNPPPGPDPALAKPVTKLAAPAKPMAKPDAPAKPKGKPAMTAADLLAGMAADPALRAAGIRLESDDLLAARRREIGARFADPGRDAGVGWTGAWLDQRLGGLRVSVPGHWRTAPDDDAAWDVPGGALVTVVMFGFEKRAPAVREYAAWMATTDRYGHERVGIREVSHPHDDAPAGTAIELVEHDPHPVQWPQRWYRLAAWSGTAILCLKLDCEGVPDDALDADVARLWRSLR
jgi:hypothetical protein